MDQQRFDKLLDDEGFSGYYNVVTDVILFDEVFLNEKAEITFNHSNSFLSAYATIRKVRCGGFKNKQILLGIPTYGRTTDRSEDAWPSIREDGQALGMWDNAINYEYTDSRTNKTRKEKAYLNSFAQIRDKTAIAFDSEIGGVMIFRAFCDAPFTEKYSLHRAVDEVVKSRKTQ